MVNVISGMRHKFCVCLCVFCFLFECLSLYNVCEYKCASAFSCAAKCANVSKQASNQINAESLMCFYSILGNVLNVISIEIECIIYVISFGVCCNFKRFLERNTTNSMVLAAVHESMGHAASAPSKHIIKNTNKRIICTVHIIQYIIHSIHIYICMCVCDKEKKTLYTQIELN